MLAWPVPKRVASSGPDVHCNAVRKTAARLGDTALWARQFQGYSPVSFSIRGVLHQRPTLFELIALGAQRGHQGRLGAAPPLQSIRTMVGHSLYKIDHRPNEKPCRRLCIGVRSAAQTSNVQAGLIVQNNVQQGTVDFQAASNPWQANYSADAARKPAMRMMKVAAHKRRSVGMTEVMVYTWG
jgi:hypothetical protein